MLSNQKRFFQASRIIAKAATYLVETVGYEIPLTPIDALELASELNAAVDIIRTANGASFS